MKVSLEDELITIPPAKLCSPTETKNPPGPPKIIAICFVFFFFCIGISRGANIILEPNANRSPFEDACDVINFRRSSLARRPGALVAGASNGQSLSLSLSLYECKFTLRWI